MQRLKPILLFAFIAACLTSCTKDRKINEAGFLVPKTVDQDPSLPAITINGAKLHSEAFGHPDSALIIVLHGGPGADYRGLLNCRDLAGAGYRVVFYDQRGSGLSERFPRKSYNSEQILFDELTGVISYYKTHPRQKVFLLGHSWGAMLAAAYVNRYPQPDNLHRVDGLVLCEPGGLVWADIMDFAERSRSLSFTSEELNDITYADQFLTGAEDEHAILDYKMALMASTNPITGEGGMLFWRYGAEINKGLFDYGEKVKPDWTANLHTYQTKVLFLYSEQNQAYGLNWARHVSAPFPNTELFLIPGVGHEMLYSPSGWSIAQPKILSHFNSL